MIFTQRISMIARLGLLCRCWPACAALVLLSVGAGCAQLGGQQTAFLKTDQANLERVTEGIKPHLVHVSLRQTTPGRDRRVGNMILRTPASSRTETLTGIVVGEGGHILVSAKLDEDRMQDVDVWIGEEEQEATFVAYDNQLGMSVLQVKTEKPLPPLALTPRQAVRPGQWLAALNTSGEDAFFVPRLGLFMVCSQRPTRYPELEFDGIGPVNQGTPLLDRNGEPVALVKSTGTATLLQADFCADLATFIAASISGESESEEDEKGFLGACLQPVNKDHARFLGVSRSGLWVRHTLPGSPADKAGLQTGDLILGVDDEPLRYADKRLRDDFNWRLKHLKLEPFTLTVWRGGETLVLDCQRVSRPEIAEFESSELGLAVREIDENAYVHRNLTVRNGVLVEQVLAGGPASTSSKFGQALVGKNDVIVELNGMPTPDVPSFSKAVEQIRASQPHAVLVKYRRGRVSGYAGLNLNIGSTSNGARQ